MPRYGSWRPLAANWADQPKLARVDLVLLHTMAGSLPGTDAYFRGDGYGGLESHFGVGGDGDVLQWQDTSRQAEANGAANARAISVETADRDGYRRFPRWSGNDVPPWTPEQLDALSELVAWSCRTHDIPCELVPDSRPGRRGIGFHRLGIEPWRVDGGETWSSATGKVCPGARRIAQIPGIVATARVLLGHQDLDPQEDDMTPEQAKKLDEVHTWIKRQEATPFDYRPHHGSPIDDQLGHTLSIRQMLAALGQKLDAYTARKGS